MRLKDKNEITCEVFIDVSYKFSQKFADYVEQCKEENEEFNPEKPWEMMRMLATDEGIELIDEWDFDYKSVFSNYKEVV